MSIKEWSTSYPAAQDIIATVQPDLTNATDVTRASQIHALRDKVQALALEVGTKPGNLPSSPPSLRYRVAALEAGGGSGATKFVQLTDGPGIIVSGQVPVGFAPEYGQAYLINKDFAFGNLIDAPPGGYPACYQGASGQYLRVVEGETGLEFATAVSTFVALTDGPGPYTGNAGKYVRVNAQADGLEYAELGGVADRLLIFSDDTQLSEPGTSWVTKKSFRIVRDSDRPPTKWRIVVSLVASGASEIAECRMLCTGTGGADISGTMSVTGVTQLVRAVTFTITPSFYPVDTLATIDIQLRKQGSGGTGVSLIYTDVFALF